MKFQTHDLIEHQNLRIEFHSGGLTYDINRPSISWTWPKLPKFRMSLFVNFPKKHPCFPNKKTRSLLKDPRKILPNKWNNSHRPQAPNGRICQKFRAPRACGVRCWAFDVFGIPRGWWCEIVGMFRKKKPCKKNGTRSHGQITTFWWVKRRGILHQDISVWEILQLIRCQIRISQFRLMASDSFSLFDVTQIKKKICHGNGKQQLQHPSFLL